MPSKLLVHPSRSADGVRHRITPESAGWTYVGFESRAIDNGARTSLKTGAREICIVDPVRARAAGACQAPAPFGASASGGGAIVRVPCAGGPWFARHWL